MSEHANLLRLLSSEAFPGIGKATVERLNRHFGNQLYEVLDQGNKKVLAGVLTKNKVDALLNGWSFTLSERAVAQWLDRYGIDPSLGASIQKAWGRGVVEKLSENPYRLLLFMGWQTVDDLAEKLGISADHPVRLVGAAEASAYAALDDHGSTWMSHEELVQALVDLLVSRTGQDKATLLACNAIEIALETNALLQAGDGYQVPGAWFGEREIEAWVRRRLTIPTAYLDDHDVLNIAQADQNITLTYEQRIAARNALQKRVSVFYGGAGVRKTSVVTAICALAERQGKRPILLALAAKAVRKLANQTGREAMTLARAQHKMTGADFENAVVVVDEFSMVDLIGFLSLIRKLPETSHLVLCGDVAQLPSIGPGRLLFKFINSSFIPSQELTVTHRQAAQTGIPEKLSEIREGRVPNMQEFDWRNPYAEGVFMLGCEGKDVRALKRLITKLLNAFKGDAQVISPLARFSLGCRALNDYIHRYITGSEEYVTGTPVVFTANKKLASGGEVVNGLQGVVKSVLQPQRRFRSDPYLEVETDDGVFIVELSESESWLEKAYALTVHRAQGSDWDTVIVILPTSKLLERSMIYTALSRSKHRCIMLAPDLAVVERAVARPPAYLERRDWLFEHKMA